MKRNVIWVVLLLTCFVGMYTYARGGQDKRDVAATPAQEQVSTVPAEKTFPVEHPAWKDKIKISQNKACRSNGDCGKVKQIEQNIIEIDWDKWEPERFVLEDNVYYFKEKEQSKTPDEEYAELEYTFEQPYIKLNPYGKTPLAAVALSDRTTGSNNGYR